MKDRIIPAAIIGLSLIVAAFVSNARYQVVAHGDVLWRLDRYTGKVSLCTLAGNSMTCTKLTEGEFAG